jgi:thiamine biosynthesis lipoprotein ApbE
VILTGTRKPALASWQALGTSVVLQLTDPDALALARMIVEGHLREIDRACSRFRADSDLELVNASAGISVRVGALLIEAVEVALRAARLTDGDVDPALGEALVIAGYDRDYQLLECPIAERGGAVQECRGHEVSVDGRSLERRRRPRHWQRTALRTPSMRRRAPGYWSAWAAISRLPVWDRPVVGACS